MTKNGKKELLLSIIATWFDDESGQVSYENCIGFYHFFIDSLEFESKFCPEYEPGFNAFLTKSISLLSDFPAYANYGISTKEGFKSLVLNNKKNITNENFDSFLISLKELFCMCKDEYFI